MLQDCRGDDVPSGAVARYAACVVALLVAVACFETDADTPSEAATTSRWPRPSARIDGYERWLFEKRRQRFNGFAGPSAVASHQP